ncbi:hypothetical protein Acr_10g0010060 [Actinidia rufa]|uniref:Uncharacterized protein n=1 Tax=Actinidia rufa TaxID=165716 RepID=A0A7J0FAD9_9ERIC|nr:hypothetical protein Acr_10g0010060 [Actinidia rufa]
MANNNQAPNLESLHREMHGIAESFKIMNKNNALLIQHLTTNNPPPLVAVPVPKEVDQSRRSHRSGDRDYQTRQSTGWAHSIKSRQRQSLSLHSRQERSPTRSESRSFSWAHNTEGEETMRRGRLSHRDDRMPRRQDKSTTQKIRDMDTCIDAINTGTNAPITVDALIW